MKVSKSIFGSKSIQPRLNLTLFSAGHTARVFPVKYNSIWLDKGQRPISLPYTVSLINVATSLSLPNKSFFQYALRTYFGSVVNFIHICFTTRFPIFQSQFLFKIIYLLNLKDQIRRVIIMNPLMLSCT